MRIKFVSRRTDHHLMSNPLITLLKPEELNLSQILQKQSGTNTTQAWRNNFSDWYVVGHDIENRYSLPSKEGLLLSAFTTDEENVLVIDNTSVNNNEVFTPEILKQCLFIAHNADHEARWNLINDFVPGRYACTMVNDKRLYAGQTGYKFDLISLINRHLGYEQVPEWMDKDIRESFKDCTFFTDQQILYNAADTIRLISIFFEQLQKAAALNQFFMCNSLNSRVVKAIAEAETTGIAHDSSTWIKIAKEREEKAVVLCQELTDLTIGQYGVNLEVINPELKKQREKWQNRQAKEQVRVQKLRLALEKLKANQKTHLKSYQLQEQQLNKLLLNPSELVVKDDGVINWGSQQQVLKVFKEIGCPIPEAKDKKTRQLKSGVGKEHRANWFVNNTDSPFNPFMLKFDQYKKIKHNISSFGENWVNQYVRDGRAYTLFDQAGTDTGRFSSGDKNKDKAKKKFANMQQIPKAPEYRNCFVADAGRSLITLDYRNCEGVIMIAQSGDLNMKKITELKDQHSYLGTKCWRNVYKQRYIRTGEAKWGFLAENYEMNKSTPEKERERDIFKNSGGLFPVAYGVFASKVTSSAKITIDEGQIFIDTIKAEIPLVIDYLDSVSKFAIKRGYVIHNQRTNSRRWFQPILDNIKYGFKIDKSEIVAIESAARNSIIQGTNSDIIKEAIAVIALWIKLYKLDIRFLLTVHDELVFDCPTEKAVEYAAKIRLLMERTAQKYLIPEINMGTSCEIGKHWSK